jgi:hypothetical protein
MGRGKARLYASFIACRAVACPRVDDVYVHTRAGLDGTCGVAAYRSMDDAAAGRGREMRVNWPSASPPRLKERSSGGGGGGGPARREPPNLSSLLPNTSKREHRAAGAGATC